MPNGGRSIFDLEYFKKRPEAFTKFAKEFLVHEDFDGVYLNQVKLTHIFARLLQDEKRLRMYFTVNLENSEEQLLPISKVVHIYGALTNKRQDLELPVTTACVKCGKEESVEKLIANLQNRNILRCREEKKTEQLFTE